MCINPSEGLNPLAVQTSSAVPTSSSVPSSSAVNPFSGVLTYYMYYLLSCTLSLHSLAKFSAVLLCIHGLQKNHSMVRTVTRDTSQSALCLAELFCGYFATCDTDTIVSSCCQLSALNRSITTPPPFPPFPPSYFHYWKNFCTRIRTAKRTFARRGRGGRYCTDCNFLERAICQPHLHTQ
jgi:hypothetical protein